MISVVQRIRTRRTRKCCNWQCCKIGSQEQLATRDNGVPLERSSRGTGAFHSPHRTWPAALASDSIDFQHCKLQHLHTCASVYVASGSVASVGSGRSSCFRLSFSLPVCSTFLSDALSLVPVVGRHNGTGTRSQSCRPGRSRSRRNPLYCCSCHNKLVQG